MKLFLNQFELDSSVEHELISNSKFYYDVEVVYEKIDHYAPIGHYEYFHNVTEVHHMYGEFAGKPAIAFESDHFRTGCIRCIDEIKMVIIRDAEKFHQDF